MIRYLGGGCLGVGVSLTMPGISWTEVAAVVFTIVGVRLIAEQDV